MSAQVCPLCGTAVVPNVRYRNYICFDCCRSAVDESGRKLSFGNQSLSGGFVAWYTETKEPRNTHVCYIDGVECWADEAHMGGIVIRVYDEEMKRYYPSVPRA
jgi:hypothetical protein